MAGMLQVLVDADNVPAGRLRDVLAVVQELAADRRIVVAGHPDALSRVVWPADADLLTAEGWQRADLALASAYTPDPGPLLLASGDSDFVTLAVRHPGPVLVVSEAAAGRFRDVATVVDPVHDGIAAVRSWLHAVLELEPD
jgi:hypothetical protein